MTDLPPDARARPGCFPLGALFLGTWFAGALVTMFGYILVVEQWGLITVRREFSYDIAFLWAPLTGLIVATALTFWMLRGDKSGRRTALWAVVAASIALLLLLLFVGLGAFF